MSIFLSALERSAARPEPSGRLTLAQRVRDRYPRNTILVAGPIPAITPPACHGQLSRFPRRARWTAAGRIRHQPGARPRLRHRFTRSQEHAMTGPATAFRARPIGPPGAFHDHPRNTDPGRDPAGKAARVSL